MDSIIYYIFYIAIIIYEI